MTKQQVHTRISYVKSVLRLAGYVMLLVNAFSAVAILLLSEALGIAEEVFGA